MKSVLQRLLKYAASGQTNGDCQQAGVGKVQRWRMNTRNYPIGAIGLRCAAGGCILARLKPQANVLFKKSIEMCFELN